MKVMVILAIEGILPTHGMVVDIVSRKMYNGMSEAMARHVLDRFLVCFRFMSNCLLHLLKLARNIFSVERIFRRIASTFYTVTNCTLPRVVWPYS